LVACVSRLRRLAMAVWPEEKRERLSHGRSPPSLGSASLRRGPAYGGPVSRQLLSSYATATSQPSMCSMAFHLDLGLVEATSQYRPVQVRSTSPIPRRQMRLTIATASALKAWHLAQRITE